MRLLAVATLLAASVAYAPTPAWAQAGWYLIPSFSLTEQFDDNIFGASSDRQSDFVSRFTPSLQGGYRSDPLTVLLLGSLTAEVFARNPDLNNATSEKHVALTLQYLPMRVLTLGLDANYTETESVTTLSPFLASALPAPATTTLGAPGVTTSPGAPGPVTGPTAPPPTGTPATTTTGPTPVNPTVNTLQFGRQRATVLFVSPSASYQLTPSTIASAGYAFTRGTLEGGVTNTSHHVPLAVSHQFTSLDSGRLSYALDIFESPDSDTVTTHALTLGWTRRLTPTTVLSLEAGPRFSEDGVTPDVNARLDQQFKLAELLGTASLGYSRSENFVLGQPGTSKTETFSGGLSIEPIRSLLINVNPAITRLTSGTGPDSTTYGVIVGASYQVLKWLSARASYSFAYQSQSGGDVRRNVVSVSLEATYPYRIGE